MLSTLCSGFTEEKSSNVPYFDSLFGRLNDGKNFNLN